jgi:hypothetical protein
MLATVPIRRTPCCGTVTWCSPQSNVVNRMWLPGHSVAKRLQRTSQTLTRQITRELHTASSSSRTKCKRTTFGACPSSK